MKIGVPKETKSMEFRVGATPTTVAGFVQHSHEVVVEKDAGEMVGFTNYMYVKAGAKIAQTPREAWDCDMIVKVKEPQGLEFSYMHEDQIIFGYLHLAPDQEQTRLLLEQKVVAIAYETVIDEDGRLPLLTPMSEIAGRMSVQAGAHHLQTTNGGRGVLLGGVSGVLPANVIIIGGGVVGTNAAQMALGLGADVTILDNSIRRLRELNDIYHGRLKTLFSSKETISKLIQHADLVIGGVLIPGKKAPNLITEEMVQTMQNGSVLVDVSIDQGGCFETSRPTTHLNPTYTMHNVIHYCVTNMPSACARTATQALTNATYPYAIRIANNGYRKALIDDKLLRQGLNIHNGVVTNSNVAQDLGYEYVSPDKILNL